MDQGQLDATLVVLEEAWDGYIHRFEVDEETWIAQLAGHLTELIQLRVSHVETWLTSNMARFPEKTAEFDLLRRSFEGLIVNVRANVQLCQLQCTNCQLSCLRARHHGGNHDCRTDQRSSQLPSWYASPRELPMIPHMT